MLCYLQAVDLVHTFVPLPPSDVESDLWKSHKKHVFVFSRSGKPIYSRYGSEEQLVTKFGVMQALVSILEDTDDVLK